MDRKWQTYFVLATYDAYGNAITGTIDTAETHHLYSGEWTNKSGQQYLRARQYSPLTGRFTTTDPYAGNTSNPQSYHKYLYAHGDPVNGVDPSGMFFSSASAGGLVASVGGYLARASTTVGSGLAVLDKAQTLADAAKLVGGLAFRGALDTQLAAGLVVSIVPFGNILSKARIIGSKAKGTLVGVGDDLSDALVELRRAAGRSSNKAVQVAGELGAIAVAKKLGMEAIEDFPVRATGIDGLFRRGNKIVIVEAKGGTSRLGVNVDDAGQMSQLWIEKQIEFLRSKGDIEWARLLESAKNEGRLQGMVVTTRHNGQGGLLDPVFDLKEFAEIGANRFR